MDNILYQTTVRTSRSELLPGIIGALSITCLIVVGVNLFAGTRAPDSVEWLTPYAAAGIFIFAVPAIWLYIKSGRKLSILSDRNHTISVEIADPKNGNIRLQGPFKVRAGIAEAYMPKGPNGTDLFLIFKNLNGDTELILKHTLGAIHTVPPWGQINEGIDYSKVYTCRKIEEVKFNVSKYLVSQW
jgi:hypothetical protein